MKLIKPSILVIHWVWSCLSFIVSASTAATHIFTVPNCTIIIIGLVPCAVNAEFQYFILRFNKNVFTLRIPLKERIGGERRPKDRMKTGLL
jgi:hypothetical protein